jgi:hypothetical protein
MHGFVLQRGQQPNIGVHNSLLTVHIVLDIKISLFVVVAKPSCQCRWQECWGHHASHPYCLNVDGGSNGHELLRQPWQQDWNIYFKECHECYIR